MSETSGRSKKYEHNGEFYRSKKFPMLEHIFREKNPNNEIIPIIHFTLADISRGYKACGIDEPASISNTILDLTRKDGPVEARLPKSIYSLGYDLVKRTGKLDDGSGKYAGEFIYVGVGKRISSWLIWPDSFEEFTIDSASIPSQVLDLIRRDEGALFSVVDYTDAFSISINNDRGSIIRVQNPMKWHPNEIDGFYISVKDDGLVYSVEAKALTTADDINLVQMRGGIKTICRKLENLHPGKYKVCPVALQGIKNGFRVGVFEIISTDPEKLESYIPILNRSIRVTFDPPISNW